MYITEKQKIEIQAIINDINKNDMNAETESFQDFVERKLNLQNEFINSILDKCVVIPEEENWEKIAISAKDMSLENVLISNYPNGVIIKNQL